MGCGKITKTSASFSSSLPLLFFFIRKRGKFEQTQLENTEFHPISPGSHRVTPPFDWSSGFPGTLTKEFNGI